MSVVLVALMGLVLMLFALGAVLVFARLTQAEAVKVRADQAYWDARDEG